MSFVHISMAQALGIWSDLCDAYHGKNGYGGDTAEIYMYRLMPNSPSAAFAEYLKDKGELSRRALAEQVKNANAALFSLLSHFAAERDCRIEVEGRPLDAWEQPTEFSHRVHVKVVRQ